ncbi:MAG: hypothetical protein JWL72_3847 [Ilumatobacteraceae bacterium]|nr:hypothetical protein [Ilumatobacteraceae bacterium]MCU1390509.1 hypothetical protein [Ilumatobacteraceae bacterium]
MSASSSSSVWSGSALTASPARRERPGSQRPGSAVEPLGRAASSPRSRSPRVDASRHRRLRSPRHAVSIATRHRVPATRCSPPHRRVCDGLGRSIDHCPASTGRALIGRCVLFCGATAPICGIPLSHGCDRPSIVSRGPNPRYLFSENGQSKIEECSTKLPFNGSMSAGGCAADRAGSAGRSADRKAKTQPGRRCAVSSRPGWAGVRCRSPPAPKLPSLTTASQLGAGHQEGSDGMCHAYRS